MARRPHVALLIESSRAYGRGLLNGIAQYARTHGPWAMYCSERGMADPVPVWLKDWDGDGIIARVETPAQEAAILETGLPVVDVRGRLDLGFPLIETNDRRVAELAAEHLLERGFQHFAFCGFSGLNYSDRRLQYFPGAIERAGFECHVFEPAKSTKAKTQRRVEMHGILFEQDVAAWLEGLPKPIGVMACNDIRGQQVLNACRAIGLAVPDEVAVIGVDNDELLCELSDPPLSSVEPNTWGIGHEAAALLDRMMKGEEPSSMKTFIEPSGVRVRLSTDVIAMEDRDVALAVRFIREHACEGINVEQVLEHVPLSRSVLDRRFTAAIGRSPKAEIQFVRLSRVKQLLKETDYPLATVSEMSGFKHTEYMCNVFKQKVGVTPGQFRQGISPSQ